MTEHATLAAALVAAVADLTTVEKGRTVDTGSYSYGYATLADIVTETRAVLAAHGLVALTPIHDSELGLGCTIVILHTSGERLDLGRLTFPHGRDAQATGSMITYHRRYALLAALGMATAEDDDGATAHARQEEQAAPPVPGFRSSLMAAVDGLTEPEREVLRAWLVEEGLPDRPSKMDAAQADKVCAYILHGLPQVEEVPA